MSVLAITGGTGFVGGRLVEVAIAAGHQVLALTRRPQPERHGVTWAAGALDDPVSLTRLVERADAVIHVAGVVNARDRAAFAAGNIDGTRAIVAAASNKRFIHVSSLAAREPSLSNYGWSKAEAERVVETSDTAWTIIRPPAIYGPGDLDQFDVFRMAKLGIALLPPPGRLSLIAVDDLAQLLLALAEDGEPGRMYEVDDGSDGYTHADYARMIGASMERYILPLPLPRPLLALGARIDRRLRGPRAKLTPDRVAYLSHPDWTIDPARRPPPELWTPAILPHDGLAETVQWYRAHGLL